MWRWWWYRSLVLVSDFCVCVCVCVGVEIAFLYFSRVLCSMAMMADGKRKTGLAFRFCVPPVFLSCVIERANAHFIDAPSVLCAIAALT